MHSARHTSFWQEMLVPSNAYPSPTQRTKFLSYLFIPALLFEGAAKTKKRKKNHFYIHYMLSK